MSATRMIQQQAELADAELSTAAHNRRRSERKPHVIEAWISSPTATDESERIEATSVNINRHGIAFHVENPLPAGTYFTIEVGMGPQKLKSEVRVISCRADASGSYEIGTEFC